MKKRVILALAAILTSLTSFSQWQQEVTPSGGIVKCFLAVNDTVYAGFHNSMVYRTTINSEKWEYISKGIVDFGGRNIIKGGNRLFIDGPSVSDDFGDTWSYLSDISRNNVGISEDDSVIISFSYDSLYISTDYGYNWERRSHNLPNAQVNDFHFFNGKLFVASDTFRISADTGKTWYTLNENFYPYSNIYHRDSTICVGGRNDFGISTIYTSDNGGKDWYDIQMNSYNAKSVAKKGDTILVGSQPYYFYSFDNGVTWFNRFFDGPGIEISAVEILNSGEIVISHGNDLYKGSFESIQIFDSGISAYQVTTLLDSETDFAISSLDYLYKREPNSTTWSKVVLDTYDWPKDIIEFNNEYSFLTSDKLYKSTNGNEWESIYENPEPWPFLNFDVNDKKTIISSYNTFMISSDSELWEYKDMDFASGYIQDVALLADTIVIGLEDSVFISKDNGTNWIGSDISFLNAGVFVKLKIINNEVFAVCWDKILSYEFESNTWSEHFSDLSLVANGYYTDLQYYGNTYIISTINAIYAYYKDTWSELLIAHPDHSTLSTLSMNILNDSIYCGTYYRGLWKSPITSLYHTPIDSFTLSTKVIDENLATGLVVSKIEFGTGMLAGNHSVEMTNDGGFDPNYYFEMREGNLITKNPLDYESIQSFNLNITFSNGVYGGTIDSIFKFEVIDVNDKPVISDILSTFSITNQDSVTLAKSDFVISDEDNTLDELKLIINQGSDYTFSELTIFPDNEFVGSLNVGVKVTDATDTSSVFYFDVIVSETVYIDNLNETDIIKVYPNPVSENLNIQVNNPLSNEKIELFNIIGIKVAEYTIPEQGIIQIDMSIYENGIYILKAKNKCIRIIKK